MGLEELKKPRDYTADLKKLLASANICDKRWVFEQYDSMVQTNTVQAPAAKPASCGSRAAGHRAHRDQGSGNRRSRPATAESTPPPTP
jgi:phosphoribosylformylglycinamidine (FGAM) synthase-like enzyme